MVEILQEVRLNRPVLVAALTGWVDAGTAGQSAADALQDELDDPVLFARVDLGELADLQQTRPVVQLVDGVTRELQWPEITFTAGRAGCDVIVCRGPEPSIRWRSFAAGVAEVARTLDVRMAVMLGGMPVPASHRRPVRVLATASSRSAAQELEPLRQDYLGPTGAQTVLQVALGAVGIPAVGLWAQVPHYLAGTLSAPAARAILSRMCEITGIDLDLRAFDAQSEAYTQQVEETISNRPDLLELVTRLDAQLDDLPSGDELVSEIEQFLRGER